ncbi:MAG TPA: TetR/AcrR family transcriptional regulator C-terminal domain-containing protein [Candidatus Limnocylindrales bacterium]
MSQGDKPRRSGAAQGVPAVDASPIPAPPWAGPQARRARRSPRPPLDRGRIVAAALAIVDADGTDALSLRRLADALHVTAMSLYWHVRDKAELLELVGQAVLAEIEIPPARGDWREQLRDVHRAMIGGFLRHPNTADVLVGRARYGAGGLALFERILSILLDAGFAPDAAFDAYQSLYLFTLGFMATSTRTPEFVEAQRQGVLYMLSLPEDRFPSIRAVVPAIGRRSLEEQFELDVDIQLEGIAARLAPVEA